MRSFCFAAAFALAGVPALAATGSPPDCRATAEIFPGTTLAGLSDTFFGDVTYRFAILLATNARVGQGFPFIGDPYRLPVGKSVCIPVIGEAEMEKNRYAVYEEAVHDMAHALPSEVTDQLDAIDTSGPVRVVTWMRSDQVSRYSDKIGQTIEIGRETWVTLTPHLQEFCAKHVVERGGNPRALTLRIEQRLGLPPNSADTHFVEFTVDHPGDPAQIFKPCVSPDVTATSCSLGPLTDCSQLSAPADRDACVAHNAFFTGQYYNSFGLSRPSEYPWTSLGYTFDWAHRPIGLSEEPAFMQFGESEFVIPGTATVTVESITPTLDYCTPK